MANWAIVVGINEYWDASANLKGALADALKMVEWLSRPDGGNVPPQNLFLLTRPFPPPSPSPLHPLINKRDATYDNLTDAITDLVNKSSGTGERLFFYFSGHGLINNQNLTDEQGLVMADFSDRRPDKAMTLSSITKFLGNANFGEQFFFIDACRNMLNWRKPFVLGGYPFPGSPNPTLLQNVSQHLLYATTPRLRAVELNEQGAFTGDLLAGLAGAGAAKLYDQDSDEYQVRADCLFTYVEEAIDQKKIPVTEPPDKPLYQKVYKEMRGTGRPPVLASMKRDQVSAEKLELYVEPNGVWTQARVKVRVTSEDAAYDETVEQVTGVPLELPPVLMPMSYSVRVAAQGYRPERRYWPVDLYMPQTRILRLLPDPASGRTNGDDEPPVGGLAEGRRGVAFDDLSTAPAVEKGGAAKKTATLKVEANDPLAPVVVTDNSGNVKAAGEGSVVANKLKPGFYRARLITPEGEMAEEVVVLSRGENESVYLEPPRPQGAGVFGEIVRKEFGDYADGSLHVSEVIGPIATPQYSTVLALAGSALHPGYGWEHRTSWLTLPTFRERAAPGRDSGIRFIYADETSDGEDGGFMSAIRLALVSQRGRATVSEWPLKPKVVERLPGLADLTLPFKPGSYLLGLKLPDGPEVNFSAAVMLGRLTLFVMHRRADGRVSVYAHSPSVVSNEDPHVAANRIRRADLLQRFHMAERVDEFHAYRIADELLRESSPDPLAACLGAYTLLKLGKGHQLGEAVAKLKECCGELSDPYVLEAEHALSADGGAESAAGAYASALERGLPILAESVRMLARGVERFDVSNERTAPVMEAAARLDARSLWAAWTQPQEPETRRRAEGGE